MNDEESDLIVLEIHIFHKFVLKRLYDIVEHYVLFDFVGE